MPTSIEPAVLVVRETTPRATPIPASRHFSEVLAQSSRAILQTAVAATAYIPGGDLIAAAIRGAPIPTLQPPAVRTDVSGSNAQAAGPVATTTLPVNGPAALTQESNGSGIALGLGASGHGTDQDILARTQDTSLRMLQLQEAISEENRRYTALSNVLHARHEMAKNAIGNIR
jgi:hypothetical protein